MATSNMMWILVHQNGRTKQYEHSAAMFDKKQALNAYKRGSSFRPSSLYEIAVDTLAYRPMKTYRANAKMKSYFTNIVHPSLVRRAASSKTREVSLSNSSETSEPKIAPRPTQHVTDSDPARTPAEEQTDPPTNAAAGASAPFFKPNFAVLRKIAEIALNRFLKKWFVDVDASHFLNRQDDGGDETDASNQITFRRGMQVEVHIVRSVARDPLTGKVTSSIVAAPRVQVDAPSRRRVMTTDSLFSVDDSSMDNEPGSLDCDDGESSSGEESTFETTSQWVLGRVTRVVPAGADGDTVSYDVQILTQLDDDHDVNNDEPVPKYGERSASRQNSPSAKPRGRARSFRGADTVVTLKCVGGHALRLRAIRFKPEALKELLQAQGLDFPLSVESGSVGRIRVYAPWKNLWSGQWKVHLEDVQIVVKLTKDAAPVPVGASPGKPVAPVDQGTGHKEKKTHMLEDEEAAAKAALDVDKDGKRRPDKHWFRRWVNSKVQQVKDNVLGRLVKIVNNMVFTLDRLHIRCEDCISTPPEGMTAQTFGVIFTQIVMNTEVRDDNSVGDQEAPEPEPESVADTNDKEPGGSSQKHRNRTSRRKRRHRKGVSILKHVELRGIGVYINVYPQATGARYRHQFDTLCTDYQRLRAFMSRPCFSMHDVARDHGDDWGQYWSNTTNEGHAQNTSLVHALTRRLVNDPVLPMELTEASLDLPRYILVVDPARAVSINLHFRSKPSAPDSRVSGKEVDPTTGADAADAQSPTSDSRVQQGGKSSKGALHVSVDVPPLHIELDRQQLYSLLSLANALSTFKVHAQFRKFKRRWIIAQDRLRRYDIEQRQRASRMAKQKRAFEGSHQEPASAVENVHVSSSAGHETEQEDATTAGRNDTTRTPQSSRYSLGRPRDAASCQRWWRYIINCVIEVKVKEDLKKRSWLRLLRSMAQRNAYIQAYTIKWYLMSGGDVTGVRLFKDPLLWTFADTMQQLQKHHIAQQSGVRKNLFGPQSRHVGLRADIEKVIARVEADDCLSAHAILDFRRIARRNAQRMKRRVEVIETNTQAELDKLALSNINAEILKSLTRRGEFAAGVRSGERKDVQSQPHAVNRSTPVDAAQQGIHRATSSSTEKADDTAEAVEAAATAAVEKVPLPQLKFGLRFQQIAILLRPEQDYVLAAEQQRRQNAAKTAAATARFEGPTQARDETRTNSFCRPILCVVFDEASFRFLKQTSGLRLHTSLRHFSARDVGSSGNGVALARCERYRKWRSFQESDARSSGSDPPVTSCEPYGGGWLFQEDHRSNDTSNVLSVDIEYPPLDGNSRVKISAVLAPVRVQLLPTPLARIYFEFFQSQAAGLNVVLELILKKLQQIRARIKQAKSDVSIQQHDRNSIAAKKGIALDCKVEKVSLAVPVGASDVFVVGSAPYVAADRQRNSAALREADVVVLHVENACLRTRHVHDRVANQNDAGNAGSACLSHDTDSEFVDTTSRSGFESGDAVLALDVDSVTAEYQTMNLDSSAGFKANESQRIVQPFQIKCRATYQQSPIRVSLEIDKFGLCLPLAETKAVVKGIVASAAQVALAGNLLKLYAILNRLHGYGRTLSIETSSHCEAMSAFASCFDSRAIFPHVSNSRSDTHHNMFLLHVQRMREIIEQQREAKELVDAFGTSETLPNQSDPTVVPERTKSVDPSASPGGRLPNVLDWDTSHAKIKMTRTQERQKEILLVRRHLGWSLDDVNEVSAVPVVVMSVVVHDASITLASSSTSSSLTLQLESIEVGTTRRMFDVETTANLRSLKLYVRKATASNPAEEVNILSSGSGDTNALRVRLWQANALSDRYLFCGDELAAESIFINAKDPSADRTVSTHFSAFCGYVDADVASIGHALMSELIQDDENSDGSKFDAAHHGNAVDPPSSNIEVNDIDSADGRNKASKSSSMFNAFQAYQWHQKAIVLVRFDSLALNLLDAEQKTVATLHMHDLWTVMIARTVNLESRLLLGDFLVTAPLSEPNMSSSERQLLGPPERDNHRASERTAAWQFPNNPLLGATVRYSYGNAEVPANCTVRARLGTLEALWVDSIMYSIAREVNALGQSLNGAKTSLPKSPEGPPTNIEEPPIRASAAYQLLQSKVGELQSQVQSLFQQLTKWEFDVFICRQELRIPLDPGSSARMADIKLEKFHVQTHTTELESDLDEAETVDEDAHQLPLQVDLVQAIASWAARHNNLPWQMFVQQLQEAIENRHKVQIDNALRARQQRIVKFVGTSALRKRIVELCDQDEPREPHRTYMRLKQQILREFPAQSFARHKEAIMHFLKESLHHHRDASILRAARRAQQASDSEMSFPHGISLAHDTNRRDLERNWKLLVQLWWHGSPLSSTISADEELDSISVSDDSSTSVKTATLSKDARTQPSRDGAQQSSSIFDRFVCLEDNETLPARKATIRDYLEHGTGTGGIDSFSGHFFWDDATKGVRQRVLSTPCQLEVLTTPSLATDERAAVVLKPWGVEKALSPSIVDRHNPAAKTSVHDKQPQSESDWENEVALSAWRFLCESVDDVDSSDDEDDDDDDDDDDDVEGYPGDTGEGFKHEKDGNTASCPRPDYRQSTIGIANIVASFDRIDADSNDGFSTLDAKWMIIKVAKGSVPYGNFYGSKAADDASKARSKRWGISSRKNSDIFSLFNDESKSESLTFQHFQHYLNNILQSEKITSTGQIQLLGPGYRTAENCSRELLLDTLLNYFDQDMNGTFSAPELSLTVKSIGESGFSSEELVYMLQYSAGVLQLKAFFEMQEKNIANRLLAEDECDSQQSRQSPSPSRQSSVHDASNMPLAATLAEALRLSPVTSVLGGRYFFHLNTLLAARPFYQHLQGSTSDSAHHIDKAFSSSLGDDNTSTENTALSSMAFQVKSSLLADFLWAVLEGIGPPVTETELEMLFRCFSSACPAPNALSNNDENESKIHADSQHSSSYKDSAIPNTLNVLSDTDESCGDTDADSESSEEPSSDDTSSDESDDVVAGSSLSGSISAIHVHVGDIAAGFVASWRQASERSIHLVQFHDFKIRLNLVSQSAPEQMSTFLQMIDPGAFDASRQNVQLLLHTEVDMDGISLNVQGLTTDSWFEQNATLSEERDEDATKSTDSFEHAVHSTRRHALRLLMEARHKLASVLTTPLVGHGHVTEKWTPLQGIFVGCPDKLSALLVSGTSVSDDTPFMLAHVTRGTLNPLVISSHSSVARKTPFYIDLTNIMKKVWFFDDEHVANISFFRVSAGDALNKNADTPHQTAVQVQNFTFHKPLTNMIPWLMPEFGPTGSTPAPHNSINDEKTWDFTITHLPCFEFGGPLENIDTHTVASSDLDVAFNGSDILLEVSCRKRYRVNHSVYTGKFRGGGFDRLDVGGFMDSPRVLREKMRFAFVGITAPIGREWADHGHVAFADDDRPLDAYTPSKYNCIDADFFVETCGSGCANGCGNVRNKDDDEVVVECTAPGEASNIGVVQNALHATLNIHCMPTMSMLGNTVPVVLGRIKGLQRKAGRRLAIIGWEPITHPHTGRLEQPFDDANVRPHFFHLGLFKLLYEGRAAERHRDPITDARQSHHESPLTYVQPLDVGPDDLVIGARVAKSWCATDHHVPALFPANRPSSFVVNAEVKTRHIDIEIALPRPSAHMCQTTAIASALAAVPLVRLSKSRSQTSPETYFYDVVDDLFTLDHLADYYRGGPGSFDGPPANDARADVRKPDPVFDGEEHVFWGFVAAALADSFRIGDKILCCRAVCAKTGSTDEKELSLLSNDCVSQVLRENFWASNGDRSATSTLVFTVQRSMMEEATVDLAQSALFAMGGVNMTNFVNGPFGVKHSFHLDFVGFRGASPPAPRSAGGIEGIEDSPQSPKTVGVEHMAFHGRLLVPSYLGAYEHTIASIQIVDASPINFGDRCGPITSEIFGKHISRRTKYERNASHEDCDPESPSPSLTVTASTIEQSAVILAESVPLHRLDIGGLFNIAEGVLPIPACRALQIRRFALRDGCSLDGCMKIFRVFNNNAKSPMWQALKFRYIRAACAPGVWDGYNGARSFSVVSLDPSAERAAVVSSSWKTLTCLRPGMRVEVRRPLSASSIRYLAHKRLKHERSPAASYRHYDWLPAIVRSVDSENGVADIALVPQQVMVAIHRLDSFIDVDGNVSGTLKSAPERPYNIDDEVVGPACCGGNFGFGLRVTGVQLDAMLIQGIDVDACLKPVAQAVLDAVVGSAPSLLRPQSKAEAILQSSEASQLPTEPPSASWLHCHACKLEGKRSAILFRFKTLNSQRGVFYEDVDNDGFPIALPKFLAQMRKQAVMSEFDGVIPAHMQQPTPQHTPGFVQVGIVLGCNSTIQIGLQLRVVECLKLRLEPPIQIDAPEAELTIWTQNVRHSNTKRTDQVFDRLKFGATGIFFKLTPVTLQQDGLLSFAVKAGMTSDPDSTHVRVELSEQSMTHALDWVTEYSRFVRDTHEEYLARKTPTEASALPFTSRHINLACWGGMCVWLLCNTVLALWILRAPYVATVISAGVCSLYALFGRSASRQGAHATGVHTFQSAVLSSEDRSEESGQESPRPLSYKISVPKSQRIVLAVTLPTAPAWSKVFTLLEETLKLQILLQLFAHGEELAVPLDAVVDDDEESHERPTSRTPDDSNVQTAVDKMQHVSAITSELHSSLLPRSLAMLSPFDVELLFPLSQAMVLIQPGKIVSVRRLTAVWHLLTVAARMYVGGPIFLAGIIAALFIATVLQLCF